MGSPLLEGIVKKSRGKPGRKSLRGEIQTADLIKASVRTLLQIQKSPNISLEDKGRFAVPIVVKHIKQQVDVTGNQGMTLNIIHYNEPTGASGAIEGQQPETISLPVKQVTGKVKRGDVQPIVLETDKQLELNNLSDKG